MIARWLDRLGQGLELVAAALLAAGTLRLMTVAVAWSAEQRAPERTSASAAEPRPTPRVAPPAAPRVPEPAPSAAKPSGGEPLRLMVAVVAGPARSDVYMNGSRIGSSPYVGDIACKRGEKLRFEIVPATGPVLERQALCEGKTLRIDD